MTSPLDKRYTKKDRFWRTFKMILFPIISIGLIALGWWTGIGAFAGIGIAGIILGTAFTLAAAYLILDSVAVICEAFNCHGYNFMRDGLYGGNAKLHMIMAFVAVAVMIVCSITAGIIHSVQARMAAKAQTVLNAADDGIKDIKYSDLPDEVKSAYDAYSKNGWKGNYKGQTPGTKAGGTYDNIPPKLPTQTSSGSPLTYREFDAVNKVAGMSRNAQRFVVSNQMTVYYTSDHYLTFFRVIGG